MSEKKTPDKELDELEDSIKGLLGTKISPSGAEVDDELSDLENTVMGALTELTDLENNLLSIIAPSGHISPDSNYLVAVRRFQNAMKIATQCGFTPSSRASLSMPEQDEETTDDFNFFD